MGIEKEIENIEKNYLEERDWQVHENANELRSFGNFISYLLDNILCKREIVEKVFSREAYKEHEEKNIHIHKLPFSLFIPYCVGWSYSKILKIGLKTPSLTSKPAKHLDAAFSHLSNFAYLAAQEFTGACAYSAFDLYSAPFIKFDNLDFKAVKQRVQSLLFDLNYPTRLGYQCPFTNITILFDVPSYLENEVYVGGKVVGKAADFLDEAILLIKALIANYNEGDSFSAPFTFPIPTLFITKNFDWNGTKYGDLTDLIFENWAKRGTFYILNGYVADVEAIYSMCCRLTIDMEKLPKTLDFYLGEFQKKRGLKGIWATPESTGSLGVVTINLPRLAFLSKGEEKKFQELLIEKLNVARKVLDRMRVRYEKSLKFGLMPLASIYLGHLNFHYSTIGLVGLPEAAANFLRNPKLWEEINEKNVEEALKFMKNTVSFINQILKEWEVKDGVLYNVEEVPAESVAYRFAQADKKLFSKEYEKGEICIPTYNGTPFYSNSIVPYYSLVPLIDRIKWEAKVQKEFTGGVIVHLFLYESIDPKALKELVRKIVTQTEIVYVGITPTISVCRKCNKSFVGIYESCPQCNNSTEIWSRIVGYYRPVRLWNIGKKAEFMKRVQYGQDKFDFTFKIRK